MEMIPLHKFCLPVALEKMQSQYIEWERGVKELEEDFQYYLEFEIFAPYEINLMASKLEDLYYQRKNISDTIERVRLEACN